MTLEQLVNRLSNNVPSYFLNFPAADWASSVVAFEHFFGARVTANLVGDLSVHEACVPRSDSANVTLRKRGFVKRKISVPLNALFLV